MFKLTLICLALFLAGPFGATPASPNDRLKSRVMEYQSPATTESQHRTVQRIILNNITYIRDNLATTSARLDYLSDVGAYPEGGQPIFTPSELPQIWNDPQLPALQVLYGEIEPAGSGVIVHSRIFIGDLPAASAAALPTNSFLVTSSLGLSEYSELADGHAYVLVYALILDAIRTGKSSDVVLALIQSSTSIYDKLEHYGFLSDALNKIHESILAIERTI